MSSGHRDEGFYSLLSSHTSAGADVVILGGDLNMHPLDLGNRLLRTSTGLRDSYTEAAKFDVGIQVDMDRGTWRERIVPTANSENLWQPCTQSISPELSSTKRWNLNLLMSSHCSFNKHCHTGSKQMGLLSKGFPFTEKTIYWLEVWFDHFLRKLFEMIFIEVDVIQMCTVFSALLNASDY